MAISFAKQASAPGRGSRHFRLGLDLIPVSTSVAGVVFALLAGACTTSAAQELTITVRVYNYSQTPSAVQAEAEREAGRILTDAGLKIVWVHCPIGPISMPQNPCPEPIEAADIRLPILSVPARNVLQDTVFGFAIAPALATVYAESAFRFAKDDEGKYEAPTILGCAIAHEIGHLLLGSNKHSVSGVMCARWEHKHVRQTLMGALLFSPGEAQRMQAEVRRRVWTSTFR